MERTVQARKMPVPSTKLTIIHDQFNHTHSAPKLDNFNSHAQPSNQIVPKRILLHTSRAEISILFQFLCYPSLLCSYQEFKHTQAVTVTLISQSSCDKWIDAHSDQFNEQLASKLWTSRTNVDAEASDSNFLSTGSLFVNSTTRIHCKKVSM